MIPSPEDDGDFPWWLVFSGALATYFLYRVIADDLYAQILSTLPRGTGTTVFVTLIGFVSACIIGLLLAAACLSRHQFLRQIARFYIEIIRGIPIVVLLLYVTFVLAPAMVAGWNWLADSLGLYPFAPVTFRCCGAPLWRWPLAIRRSLPRYSVPVCGPSTRARSKRQRHWA